MRVKIVTAPCLHHPVNLRQISHTLSCLPPYGAGCLSAFLKRQGYTVSIEDLSRRTRELKEYLSALDNRKMLDRISDYLLRNIPNKKIDSFAEAMYHCIQFDQHDVIGFSVFSRLELPSVLLMAKKIKEKTGLTIVLGGPLITIYTEYIKINKIGQLLVDFPFIDFAIFGEGYIPLFKLLQHLEGREKIENVPNLAYRKNKSVVIAERKFFNIEDMPLPDFESLSIDKYQSYQENDKLFHESLLLPYQITRGCTQRCNFCNFYLVDPQLEFKTPQKVVNELAQMKGKYHTRRFFFCESRINNSYVYLESLCDIMVQSELDIIWDTVAGINGMDANLIRKMSNAGCHSIAWGIESGSDRILKLLNKGFSIAEAEKVLRESSEAGIRNIVNFITGFPHETEEDISLSIRFIKDNVSFIDKVRLFDFALVLDSPIYNQPGSFGIENTVFNYDSHIGFHRLAFDETGGLKWREKLKQKKKFYRKLQRAVNELFPRSRNSANKLRV